MRTILEDLNFAAQEPSTEAAAAAKKLGLVYVGFGRYEDPKTNQITYTVQNNKLVPFRKAIKTNTYRNQQSDDIGNYVSVLSPEVQYTNDVLSQMYPPQNYDENELNAIQQFTSTYYSDINDTLSNLPAGISAKQIQPTGPDDIMPNIIAALDSALKRSRSPIDFITYTKLGDDTQQMQLAPGSQFRFKGFRNTTINLANVLTPDDNKVNILQIRVKKNSRGLYAANYSQNPQETEFILPRASRIEVLAGPTKLVGSDAQLGNKYKEIYYYDCQTKS